MFANTAPWCVARARRVAGATKRVPRANPHTSWPGLSRPSTSFSCREEKNVDGRNESGHDEGGQASLTRCSDFSSHSGRTAIPHPGPSGIATLPSFATGISS